MLNFEEFQNQVNESHDIVSGLPDQASKTHKSIIRQKGGVIHSHTNKDGVHTVVHSSKSGVMRVSEFHPSSEKNKTSSVITRKATDREKRAHSTHFIVSD